MLGHETRAATDDELVVGIRRGSSDSTAELWRRFEPRATRFARRLVPASDVDDVVAEAFTKTLAAIRRGRGPADQPMRYLMIAVRHTAYRSGSQRIRLAELAARNTDATPTSVAAPELGDEALVGAFAALAPRWRQALWLSEVEGLSPVELGDRLDLTPAAAAALTYRARRALRATYGLAAAG